MTFKDARQAAIHEFERKWLVDELGRFGTVRAICAHHGLTRSYGYKLCAKHGIIPREATYSFDANGSPVGGEP